MEERFFVDFSQTYFCYLIRDRQSLNPEGKPRMVLNTNLFSKKEAYEECEKMNASEEYAESVINQDNAKNIQHTKLRRVTFSL